MRKTTCKRTEMSNRRTVEMSGFIRFLIRVQFIPVTKEGARKETVQ
jgi:hypothetical protein